MRIWSEPLDYEVPELFSGEDRPEFPDLEEAGIRINADHLSYDGGTLGLKLMVTHCFPAGFESCFDDIDHALTLIVEHPESGRSFNMRLKDPHKVYARRDGPNFTPATVDESGELVMGFIEIPLAVRIPPSAIRPAVFLRVMLHEHVSNTMAVELEGPGIESFLAGTPAPLPLIGLDEAGPDEDEAEES